MWLVVLSDQLPIIALVGHYLTNQLMGREPLRKRIAALINKPCSPLITSGINSRFQELFQTCGQVTHVFLTLAPLNIAVSFDLHA